MRLLVLCVLCLFIQILYLLYLALDFVRYVHAQQAKHRKRPFSLKDTFLLWWCGFEPCIWNRFGVRRIDIPIEMFWTFRNYPHAYHLWSDVIALRDVGQITMKAAYEWYNAFDYDFDLACIVLLIVYLEGMEQPEDHLKEDIIKLRRSAEFQTLHKDLVIGILRSAEFKTLHKDLVKRINLSERNKWTVSDEVKGIELPQNLVDLLIHLRYDIFYGIS